MGIISEERLWAGTDASYATASRAEEEIEGRLADGLVAGVVCEADEEKPRLLDVSDGVAVISIKGPLVNNSAPRLEYYGMTGYPEICDALVAAAEDTSVKRILLDINSGGGAVSGMLDTAALIRLVHNDVKPVTAFSDGTMASAAYALGVAAGDVYATKTTLVGSIGIMSTHREFSEAHKRAGIGVKVIRAGQYKALVNSDEPLSKEGERQIQQVVDAAYSALIEHVVEMRGKSYEYTDKVMAQGREFVGHAAVDTGLVDGIANFNSVLSALKEKAIDTANGLGDNRAKLKDRLAGYSGTPLSGETAMKRRTLTAQDIAALQAGVPLDLDAQNEPSTKAEADAATVEPANAAVNESATAENGAENTTEASVENPDKIASTIQYMTAQLKDRDEALLEARIQVNGLEKELTEARATATPLLDIAAKSINHMRVALNLSPLDFSAMSAVQVLAEHGAMTEQFQTQFKAGGVAAVGADQSRKSEMPAKDAMAQARLAAVPRFSR